MQRTKRADDSERDAGTPDAQLPKVRYRDFLEGLGAAVFGLDLSGRFLFLNTHALDLLGYDRDEQDRLIGQHFAMILAPDQAKVAQELFLRGREIRPVVLQVTRKDGRPVSLEVSGAWVRRRGRRVGALAMAWEVGAARLQLEETNALSNLDLAILRFVSSGLSNRQIAERVYLSTHTIKDRLERIMRSFGVRRRAELAAKAARRGLV